MNKINYIDSNIIQKALNKVKWLHVSQFIC